MFSIGSERNINRIKIDIPKAILSISRNLKILRFIINTKINAGINIMKK